MNTEDETIETHLNDLQSEMEAAGRKVERIRSLLLETQFRQASTMGSLVRKMEDLKASVRQQRETLRTLRTELQTRLLR